MPSHEGQVALTKWIGVLFYWLIFLGRYKFEHLNSTKFRRRNLITGYILTLLFAGLIILIMIYNYLE